MAKAWRRPGCIDCCRIDIAPDENGRCLDCSFKAARRGATGTPKAPTSYVRWEDSAELDAAAESAYIEFELEVRGDGMWRPWHELDALARLRWERVATAVLRTMNQRRGRAAAVAGTDQEAEPR